MPVKFAFTGPILTVTFALRSVSDVLLISWHPGMASFRISGSLSAFQTASRDAGMISSPLIFMDFRLSQAPQRLLRFARPLPLLLHRGPEVIEAAPGYGRTNALHQLLIVSDIRPGE